MSLSRLWLFLAVALPVLASLLASMSTVDLTYHLRAGSEILDTRNIPTVDTWTFTAAGHPWVDQQWGAQVVLALADGLGGWTGLAILRGVLTGVIFACLVAIGRARGLDGRTAALLTLAAFVVAAPAMALRPQLIGMACFAVVLVLITGRRAHPRRLWLIPLVVAIWANLHGSFFLGPVVLGLAWLEDVHDRVASPHRGLVIAVASIVAACLTPFGPSVWAYAVGLSTNPEVTARITEWQPTSIRDVPGILFFASVFGVVVLLARRGRATVWPTLTWLGLFVLIGLYAQRGVAWWPLAAVTAVAGTLLPASTVLLERADPRTMRRLNAVVAGALALVGLIVVPAWRPIDPDTGTPLGVLNEAPPGITAALRELAGPGHHVFNPQPWGSWFEYTLPDLQYAIDSRIELFPTDVWRDYERVVAGVDGWEARLTEWDVVWIVLEVDETGFQARLEAAGWIVAYDDDDGAIMTDPRAHPAS